MYKFNFNILKHIREKLNLTQNSMALAVGISQRDISQLESSLKKFIPIQYYFFLIQNSINISILFSEDIENENINIPENIKYYNNENLAFNYKALKIEREKLNIDLNKLKDYIGLSEKDLALLENGGRKFIPINYIHLLFINKIELNTFFRENIYLDNNINTDKKAESKVENVVNIIDPKSAKTYDLFNSQPFSVNENNTIEKQTENITNIEKEISDTTKIDNNNTEENNYLVLNSEEYKVKSFKINSDNYAPMFFENDIFVGLLSDINSIEFDKTYLIVLNTGIIEIGKLNVLISGNKKFLITENNKTYKISEVLEIYVFKYKISTSLFKLRNYINELELKFLKKQQELELLSKL